MEFEDGQEQDVNSGSEAPGMDENAQDEQNQELETAEPELKIPEPKDEEIALDDLPLPGDETEDKKSELPKWAEKRLSKKEREIQQVRADAEALRAENEKLKNHSLTQAPAKMEAAPERDDFDTDADYISSIVHYTNKQAFETLLKQKAAEEKRRQDAKFSQDWHGSEETGLKKYEDFDEKFAVLNSDAVSNNRMMAEAIIDSPFKEDIQYFLGSHPEHAAKLSKLNGVQAVKEITKIEERFKARKQAAKITKATAPLDTLKSNKGAPAKVNPENLPQEDFAKWYKEKYQ